IVVPLEIRRENLILPYQQVSQRSLVDGPAEAEGEVAVVGAGALTQLRRDRQPQHQHATDASDDRLTDSGPVEKFEQFWRGPELPGHLIERLRHTGLRLLVARERKPKRGDAEHRDLSGAADDPIGVADPRLRKPVGQEQKLTNHRCPLDRSERPPSPTTIPVRGLNSRPLTARE